MAEGVEADAEAEAGWHKYAIAWNRQELSRGIALVTNEPAKVMSESVQHNQQKKTDRMCTIFRHC